MKEEIERIARKFINEKRKYKLTEIDILYYLSGYFKHEKMYLADVLEVVRKLQDENLIEMSF